VRHQDRGQRSAAREAQGGNPPELARGEDLSNRSARR
jgi:hypothetical protein